MTEEITSLISLQESIFSDVSKAKVLEVQKQLHKEEKKNYKKNQRGAVYQRQLREKRIDGIQKLCKKEPGAAEILQQNSFNWTKTNRLRAEID